MGISSESPEGLEAHVELETPRSEGMTAAERAGVYAWGRRALALLGAEEVIDGKVVVGAMDGDRDLIADLIHDLDAEVAEVQMVLIALEDVFEDVDTVEAELAFQTEVAWESVKRLRSSTPGYRDLVASFDAAQKLRSTLYETGSTASPEYQEVVDECKRLAEEITAARPAVRDDMARAKVLSRRLTMQRTAARAALRSLLSAGPTTLTFARERYDDSGS